MEAKKNNKAFIIIFTIVITLTIVFVLTNYGLIIKTFYPPNPKIVSSELNDSPSRLFEYSANVEAVIRNDGGDGDIVFEATVLQDGKSWTKTSKRYFKAKETAKMQLQFDEVKLLEGKYKAKIATYSFGK